MDAAYVAEFSAVPMSFDAKITWQSIMYAPRTMMIVQKYQVFFPLIVTVRASSKLVAESTA